MNNNEGPLGGPWPDLAPPPEAVHLFHSYEDLKAQLMPVKVSPQQQTASEKSAFPTDSLRGTGALPREPPLDAAAAHPSHESRSLLQPFSKSFSLSRGSASSPCAPITGGLPSAVFRRNGSPTSRDGSSLAAPGTLSLHDKPAIPSPNTEEAQGISGPLEKRSNKVKRAATSPRHTQSSSLPITTRTDRDELSAQRRARSSEAVGSPLGFVKSRGKREDALGVGEQQEDTSDVQNIIPPEVESVLMRLQHRSCSTGMAAPFSWRRARERARAVAAAARSSSSSNCIATEGKWKFDGDMLVPGDTEKTKALRQKALDRVRQRAREAREREQQQMLQQQLEQEEQHQRSQVLSKQLRQRTLQRIRENALRQEEQRQQQELLQQQMMREAEVQRQYCARHRKALQQRLLQQQHEIKEKIRIHAEESVRQSRDSKERIAAEVAAFRRRTIERLQAIEGPLKALMRLREARRLRNEFFEV